MEMWQQLAPAAYAEIEEPSRHFSRLGVEAMAAWEAMVAQMEQAGPRLEGLAEIGRVNSIRNQADEVIRREWCLPPADLIEDEDWPLYGPVEARKQMYLSTLAYRVQSGLTLDELGLTIEEVTAATGWTQEDLDEMAEDADRSEGALLSLADILAMEPYLTISVHEARRHPEASVWEFWGLEPEPVMWPESYQEMLAQLNLPPDFPVSPLTVLRAGL
jgi:hypothetical protein